MFTGLIQAHGIVLVSADTDSGKRLTVSMAELAGVKVEPGDSVCVSGVCLTVVRCANSNLTFDVVAETLARSTLGGKKPQDRVNLELSLRPDSFVGGHFVQGHVDAVGTVAEVRADPRDWRITFEVADAIMPAIVPKGSVAVDGVSMTIAEIRPPHCFTLAVIPTTLERTTLSALAAGDKVNVETDILARTVVHYLQNLAGGKTQNPDLRTQNSVTIAQLRELGFA